MSRRLWPSCALQLCLTLEESEGEKDGERDRERYKERGSERERERERAGTCYIVSGAGAPDTGSHVPFHERCFSFALALDLALIELCVGVVLALAFALVLH